MKKSTYMFWMGWFTGACAASLFGFWHYYDLGYRNALKTMEYATHVDNEVYMEIWDAGYDDCLLKQTKQ